MNTNKLEKSHRFECDKNNPFHLHSTLISNMTAKHIIYQANSPILQIQQSRQ